MFQSLYSWIRDRWVLPKALEYLRTKPGRVAEFVLSTETLTDAVLKGVLSERPLAQKIAARSETVFRHAEGNPDLENKIARAAANLADSRPEFRHVLRAALYQSPSWVESLLADPEQLNKQYVFKNDAAWEKSIALGALHRLLKALKPWLDAAVLSNASKSEMASRIANESELRREFYAAFCADGELPLAAGRIRLPDTHSFWPQLFEIFVREDYSFETETVTPYIIDAGMHMGLATYYFKTKYPGARVVAFEPSPMLRPFAEENIARCGFNNVTIEPYALNREDGTLTFYVDGADTMAGSLSAGNPEATSVEVKAVRLSPYLDRPVDYLKMDIEGAEGGVLAEAAHALGNVRHLFIEYHEHHVPSENSLPAILQILDQAGFDYEVAKSFGYQQLTERHPMRHTGQNYSALIWAKNRTWPPAGNV